MKAVFIVVLFGVALLLLGCGDGWCDGCRDTGGPVAKESYFLVNSTDDLLHYQACYTSGSTTYRFDTILPSKDTLFLYWRKSSGRILQFEDYTFYMLSFKNVVIQSNSKRVLFSNVLCGKEDFVSMEIDDRNVHYYWTIDSAYIAEKACGIDFQSNEAIIGIETCLEIEFQEEVSDEN